MPSLARGPSSFSIMGRTREANCSMERSASFCGEAPAWAVCVGGTRNRAFTGGEFGMPCVLVLKRLDEGGRMDKAALNDVLRDHGVNA